MRLEDIEIGCGPGWNGILRRMMAEISRADVKVSGLVADERNGHLSIDYSAAEPWLAAAKIFLLAECRSYYVCETCGRPGEHRGDGPIWRTTRCAEHQSENPGRLVYDRARTPWRRMTDGVFRYDVEVDRLVPEERADVVARWQRGEVTGHDARQLTGAASYGDLYKWCKRFDIEVRVLPRDLLDRIEAGTMSDADAAAFLGTDEEGWLALKVGLT